MGAEQRFANDAAGIAALRLFCTAQGATLVAMEATGGYEKLAFGLLWADGLPVAIVNPRAVRDFAKAMGHLEKTDRIDAKVIAWYAATKGIVPQQPASADQTRLRALVTRLRQLTELRTSQTLQAQRITDPDVLASFTDLAQVVTRQSRTIEAAIAALIDKDQLWKKLDETFRSIKGVADRTAARLMAEMPEIGTLSGKAVAKLAGLAPLAQDSGQSKGNRSIRGGRQSLRDILFIVASVVQRHEPDFKAFAATLEQAGKPKKVIRVALARKLLVRLNAKAKQARAELKATLASQTTQIA